MRIILFLLLLLTTLVACDKRHILDRPVIADNYADFMEKLNDICSGTDKDTCEYIKGPIYLALPKASEKDYTPSGDEAIIADEVYKKLNGKTPQELVQIYKGMLLNNLETVRKRDIEIKRNLDLLLSSYESTKDYANNLIVTDVMLIPSKNINNMKIGFTVTNRTEFILKQLVVEAEFYSSSDILLGRTKSFVCVLSPNLKPKAKAIIKTKIDTIPEEDLVLIRAAKNLKIRVTVSSIQTTSKNDNEKNIVLSLPYSYKRMRELLSESELLYNDTVNKINAIKAYKGDK